MRYKTTIDVMVGERYDCTLRNYVVDTAFKGWVDGLVEYVLEHKPYLRRRPEFDLYWKVPGQSDAHLTIQPN